jgi:hypothetical protein
VNAKGSASRILALSAQQMPREWETRYGCCPLLLETLVDAARFRGTCYRAANWIHVRQTVGRGRMDQEHKAHAQAVKDIVADPQLIVAGDLGVDLDVPFLSPYRQRRISNSLPS